MKIKIQNCTIHIGPKTPIMQENGDIIWPVHPLTQQEVEADPHEALKALEEQTPEVLRDRDFKIELYQEKSAKAVGFEDGYGAGFEDASKPPWANVTECPPPMDGTPFFLRRKRSCDKVITYHTVWRVQDGEGRGWRTQTKYVFWLDGNDDWMPIPE